MKSNYTYTEIYTAINKHSYELNADYKFPEWIGTVQVELTPELAKALVEHDNKIQSYKKYKNNNDIGDKDSISTQELSQKIELEASYEIRKGQRYLEYVSTLDHPVTAEITVYNDNKDPKILFCDLMKDSVTDLYAANNKMIEELDSTIWREQLLSIIKQNMEQNGITKESFIDLLKSKEELESNSLQEPVLVAIMSKNRKEVFPDKIAFITENFGNTNVNMFSCNLIPSLQNKESGYVLKPGCYKNILFATTENDGFIQANPIEIYTVELDESSNIKSYKKTDYTFMRITIPLQENVPNGIFPMGALFETDTIKKAFIDSIDFSLMHVYQSVPYIILEEADFE